MGPHLRPGQRGFFDNVRVDASRRIGSEGQGMAIALAARIRSPGIAAATGLAQSALDLATSYAKDRVQFGRADREQPGPRLPDRGYGGGVGAARASYLYAAGCATRDGPSAPRQPRRSWWPRTPP